MCGHVTADCSGVTKGQDGDEAAIHKIRITLTGEKVEALEKGTFACSLLIALCAHFFLAKEHESLLKILESKSSTHFIISSDFLLEIEIL